MEKTTKIENDHADEQIEVEGSSISSKSEDAGEHDEFRTLSSTQNRGKNQWGKMPTTMRIRDKSPWKEPISPPNTPTFPSAQTSRNSSNPYKGNATLIKVYSAPPGTRHQTQSICPRIYPSHWISWCFPQNAEARQSALNSWPFCARNPSLIKDEPALNQSDKAKVDLQLINNNKQYRGGKNSKIHSIENAEKNPKQILAWIGSVADIHKTKQPPSVSYSKPMPDIDALMQEWPAQVE